MTAGLEHLVGWLHQEGVTHVAMESTGSLWLLAAVVRGPTAGRTRHAFALVAPPATLSVVTFGEDVEPGRAARRFCERLGFRAAEAAPDGPEGGSRQVYRREFPPQTQLAAQR